MTMAPVPNSPRRGFSLIEVMIALVILGGVVLTMALGTTKFSASIRNSDVRNRAQSVADMQIGRARAWPTYSTLSQLSTERFNPAEDGLSSVTTGGQSITRVTVTVSAAVTANLPVPIKRSIIIAAP